MELGENAAKQAGELAEKHFREDKHSCAEAVIRGALEAAGKDCPLDLVKLGSPFGRGMGGGGCACGALVGAQIVQSLFFGRESADGPPPDRCAKASRLLHDRFKHAHKATCCRILRKGLVFGSPEQIAACAAKAGSAATLALEVIKELLEDAQAEGG